MNEYYEVKRLRNHFEQIKVVMETWLEEHEKIIEIIEQRQDSFGGV